MDHRELYHQYSDEMDKINAHFQEHPYPKMPEEEFLVTLSGVEISKYKGLEVFPNGFTIRTSNNMLASFMELDSNWRETRIAEDLGNGTIRIFDRGLTPPQFSIMGDNSPYKSERRFYDSSEWQNGDEVILTNKCLREGLSFIENNKYLSVTEEDRKKAMAGIGQIATAEVQNSDTKVVESPRSNQQENPMDPRKLYQQYSDEVDQINTYFQEKPFSKMPEEEFLTIMAGVEIPRDNGFRTFINQHVAGFVVTTDKSQGAYTVGREGRGCWQFEEQNKDGTCYEFHTMSATPMLNHWDKDHVSALKSEPRLPDFYLWQKGDDTFLFNKCLREGLSSVVNNEHLFVTEKDREKTLAARKQLDAVEDQNSDTQVAEVQNNNPQEENSPVEVLQPESEAQQGQNLQEENPLEAMFHDHESPNVINALNTLAAAGIELSAEQKQIISRSNANNAGKESPSGYTKH